MERRKIILFGKSAYCMTLPQAWVTKHKLKKGDLLNVQETLRSSLELIPSAETPPKTSSLMIDITSKSTDEELAQILLATYLNGYTVVTLLGANSGKIAFLREHIHEYIAAEIMEVTSTKVVIHIFWDIDTINLVAILRRIGHIIRSIFEETVEVMGTLKHVNDIAEKGCEVQRQVLLGKRAITYALNNAATAQKLNFSSLELHYLSYILYFSGKIGEHLLVITGIVQDASKEKALSVAQRKELKLLLKRASNYYEKVLDIYNKPGKQHKFVISEYNAFEEAISLFRKKSYAQWGPVVAEYVMLLAHTLKEMQFVIISLENSPKL